MSDTKTIIDELSRDVGNITLDMAAKIVAVELDNPDVLDSKVACDAIKRAVANIRAMVTK